MECQSSIAKYKIKKNGPLYIVYDLSIMSITSIIGVTYTFWGAKKEIKKYIKNKNTEYYFTKDGVLINE